MTAGWDDQDSTRNKGCPKNDHFFTLCPLSSAREARILSITSVVFTRPSIVSSGIHCIQYMLPGHPHHVRFPPTTLDFVGTQPKEQPAPSATEPREQDFHPGSEQIDGHNPGSEDERRHDF